MKYGLILSALFVLTAPVAAHAAPTDKKPAPAKHVKPHDHGARHAKAHAKQQQHTSVGGVPKSATIFDERPHKVEF